jgi:iron complex transport system ATP-binding protein
MSVDISVRQISFTYDPPRWALSNVSFDIPAGRFCGIIGPNGSGKTTLLKCISGYIKPDFGSVTVGGRDVTTMPAREVARRMALVQQHAALEYEFTVGDIVLTGRNPHLSRWRGESKDDYAIAMNALEAAGIAHLKDRLVTELSGGEWQMMILARALTQQADIMLLDEPVTGLDIRHQVHIMGTVKRLAAQRGISVVCVLHDLNLALTYCDQIVLMQDGSLAAVGLPADVLTRDRLESVYGTKLHIIESDGQTFLLPVMK